VKQQRKPPRALTRVAGVEANVELGMKLVALRAELKSNRAFGRAVRAQFDIDTMHAVECARRPGLWRTTGYLPPLVLERAGFAIVADHTGAGAAGPGPGYWQASLSEALTFSAPAVR
jgi:hypothetical protein